MRAEGVGIAIDYDAGEDPEDAGLAWEHAAGNHDDGEKGKRGGCDRESILPSVDRYLVSADPPHSLNFNQSSSCLTTFENRTNASIYSIYRDITPSLHHRKILFSFTS